MPRRPTARPSRRRSATPSTVRPPRSQAREICTYETDETNPETGPFDKTVSQKDCLGPWKSRATGKQNSSGQTTFTISNPLEVEHTYRAVSGSTTSNEIKFAAPLPTNPYGTDTGLSEVHFNTYEGDTVNTRTRYFEGAFSMTASEKKVPPPTRMMSERRAPRPRTAARPRS